MHAEQEEIGQQKPYTAEVLWSIYSERDGQSECAFVGSVRGAIECILVARWLKPRLVYLIRYRNTTAKRCPENSLTGGRQFQKCGSEVDRAVVYRRTVHEESLLLPPVRARLRAMCSGFEALDTAVAMFDTRTTSSAVLTLIENARARFLTRSVNFCNSLVSSSASSCIFFFATASTIACGSSVTSSKLSKQSCSARSSWLSC